MKNYREQEACAKCKHCYVFHPVDDPFYFYCNITGDRPLNENDPEYRKLEGLSLERLVLSEAFDKWCEGKAISSHGICDQYEKEKTDGAKN